MTGKSDSLASTSTLLIGVISVDPREKFQWQHPNHRCLPASMHPSSNVHLRHRGVLSGSWSVPVEQSWHQRQQAVIESGWSFQRQPLAHVTSIYIISCQQYSLDASSLHNSAYIFRQPVWQKQELTSHPFTHQRSRVVESITFSGLRSCSGARGVWRLLSHRKGRMIINSRLNRPIRLNLTAWT